MVKELYENNNPESVASYADGVLTSQKTLRAKMDEVVPEREKHQTPVGIESTKESICIEDEQCWVADDSTDSKLPITVQGRHDDHGRRA